MSTGPSERLVVAGAGLPIEIVRQGEGPPVVLIPSLGRGAEDFAELAPALADRGWCVLCPEPRGFGESGPAEEGTTLRDLAGDVAAVLRWAGAAPALVAGHAFGSWVARMLATGWPDLVAAVALLAAAPKGPIPPGLRARIDICADLAVPREVRLANLRHVYFAPSSDPETWLEGWNPAVARLQRAAAAFHDQEEWWAAGGRPILDLQAEHDAFLPTVPWMALKDELGPRVTIRTVAEAGHALVPERPEAVAAALDAYAREVLGTAGPTAGDGRATLS